MDSVIPTEVLSVLSSTPMNAGTQEILSKDEGIQERLQRVEQKLYDADNQPKPKEEKESLWSKVTKVIKKVVPVVLSFLSILAPILNAVSRFNSKSKRHQCGRKNNRLVTAI